MIFNSHATFTPPTHPSPPSSPPPIFRVPRVHTHLKKEGKIARQASAKGGGAGAGYWLLRRGGGLLQEDSGRSDIDRRRPDCDLYRTASNV